MTRPMWTRFWTSLLLLALLATTVASCVLVYRAEARTRRAIERAEYRLGGPRAEQTLDQYRLDRLEDRLARSEADWRLLVEKNTKEREWIGMLLIANLASVLTALMIWIFKRHDPGDGQ